MQRNRPRIRPRITELAAYSCIRLKIRGWRLGAAKVNGLPALCLSGRLQSAGGGELRRRRTLMPSILDKAFRGELRHGSYHSRKYCAL